MNEKSTHHASRRRLVTLSLAVVGLVLAGAASASAFGISIGGGKKGGGISIGFGKGPQFGGPLYTKPYHHHHCSPSYCAPSYCWPQGWQVSYCATSWYTRTFADAVVATDVRNRLVDLGFQVQLSQSANGTTLTYCCPSLRARSFTGAYAYSNARSLESFLVDLGCYAGVYRY